MAQETITVMVCDRCGERLELRGDKKSDDYAKALHEAGRWGSLRWTDMGGDQSYLLCKNDWAEFHGGFMVEFK